MKTNPGLLALAAGAFAIGVTEFAPMGLLPVIAGDLGVSIPRAGLLVSAYALGVMLGAPLMTLGTRRLPRRTLLLLLTAIFTLGNLMAALATSYEMLLAARIVTSLHHGAFFGVGAIVAAGLVPPERRAGAVATMFMGLTLATVVGVPLASWAGETLGWRVSFWAIAGLGLATLLALRLTLPALPAPDSGDAMAEIRALGQRRVLGALLLTVVGSSAMFTVFTYIAPILREATGASPGYVTAMLVTYGLGLTLGNGLGGRFADRSVDRTLIAALAGLALVLLAFAWFMPDAVVSAGLIFLWGIASFALVPPLQVRVMGAAAAAPSLASSVNIGAFNLGNALGAALGGGVIAAGWGYPAVALAGAATALAGLAMVLYAARRPAATGLAGAAAE
ncbi:MFS transporter [Roseomonas sp. USHLN139]|uniref:MFS transporter n=1 Tax=Roseomonas sp. USHLN139 TaxID=3081298 RepID=UPI003B01EF13